MLFRVCTKLLTGNLWVSPTLLLCSLCAPCLLIPSFCLTAQGFNDQPYKQRRVDIANIARQHEM